MSSSSDVMLTRAWLVGRLELSSGLNAARESGDTSARHFEQSGRVKSRRRFVGPNPGFQSQLRLYHVMGWKIDRSNNQFRLFRLHVAADMIKKAKILPQSCMDVIKSDPALITVKPEPVVYRCHKCRRILASASNLLPHNTKQKSLWVDGKWLSRDEGTPALCSQTYFVEPLAWMSSVPHSLQGKLHCPKCQNKLGSFSWIMGCQCPCGSKISPAFYLVPSKVEWSNMVQNVQVTLDYQETWTGTDPAAVNLDRDRPSCRQPRQGPTQLPST
uniref:protein-tyrosine-phosphatase n=1 Tax=Timema genevievae TaxID=629358 RepID=A0A7R9K6J0_TIMGE|nr:unnamed protein product [Timema genevievae]